MENQLTMATSRSDIYIKKAGNLAGVIFRTKRAVKIAKESNVPNHYEGESNYRFDISKPQAIKILTWAITHKLSVDSEVPMVVEDKREEMLESRRKERANR